MTSRRSRREKLIFNFLKTETSFKVGFSLWYSIDFSVFFKTKLFFHWIAPLSRTTYHFDVNAGTKKHSDKSRFQKVKSLRYKIHQNILYNDQYKQQSSLWNGSKLKSFGFEIVITTILSRICFIVLTSCNNTFYCGIWQ